MPREADFEESADMRLVELQRAALGVAPQKRHWESRIQTEGGAVEAEVVEPSASAVLEVDLVASPRDGVISGAVVTLTLSIVNNGALPAQNLLVAVPVPGDASYRSGSLLFDGRPEDDGFAETFLGEGVRIAQLLPKSRTTFVWKIGVRAGTGPLLIAPAIRAEGAAVVGGAAHLITRKDESQTAFAAQLSREVPQAIPDERPFYELDEEEELEHLAGDAALSPVIEVPPVAVEQVQEPAQPEQPAPVQPPREAIVLTGTFDRPSLAYFERIFSAAKPPTLLSHFIFAGALACNRSYATGEELGGLKRHMDAQSQILHRITLHEKLGRKEPITEYAGKLEFDAAPFVPERIGEPAMTSTAERLILETELNDAAVEQVRKHSNDAKRWDFVAARQVTLLLQARSAIAGAPAEILDAANAALRAYADAAATHLSKFFVRIRLDRTTGALYQKEPSLDEAARSALQTLRRLFESLDEPG